MKPEDRTRLVMQAIGWQGGTVHQLCAELSVDCHEFLYSSADGVGEPLSDFTQGWYSAKLWHESQEAFAIPQRDIHFWFGVASFRNLLESDDEASL